MPSALTGQEPREDSPPSQPENAPVDTQPAQPDASGAAIDQTAPESSTPHGEATPKSDVPRDEAGRFAPKDAAKPPPDTVEAAIDRLVKKTTPPEPDPTKQPGKAAAEAKPKEAPKAPEAKPTDEALKTCTKDDLDATPEEKAAWKPHTRERFDRVLTAAKEARIEVERLAPLAEQGKEYAELLDTFELRQDIGFVPPEHIAGLIKVQAAVNRGLLAVQQGRLPAPQDVGLFEELAGSIDKLRSQLGVAAPTPKTTEVQPLAGELPPDLAELVSVYGIDEKRVRLLAAMEAKAPQAAAKPTTPAPAAPAEAAPQAQPKPVGPDMGLLYARRLAADLQADGVQNPGEHMRVLIAHPATKQEVIRRFPGLTLAEVPQVFNALDDASRYDVLKAAHKAMTAKTVPVPPRQTPPPPATPNRGIPTTASPRRAATPTTGATAVDSAIDYLAGN